MDEPVVDRLFSDPVLADLYDAFNPWGLGHDFYAALALDAASVLDLGCGTGLLLRGLRERGHDGDLCGVDPSPVMLDVARRSRDDVEWIVGDARSFDLGREFELVTMTGHAFQVLLTDDDVRSMLGAVRRHVGEGGRLVFETRNPRARAWEGWTSAHPSPSVIDAAGAVVKVDRELRAVLPPDLVDFENTFRSPRWDRPIVSASRLRFIALEPLVALVEASGFHVASVAGDWNGAPVDDASPELIVDAVSR